MKKLLLMSLAVMACSGPRVSGPGINNRRAAFIFRINARAKRRRQSFFHHINFSDMRFFNGVKQSSLFDVRCLGNHSDNSLPRNL